MPQETVFMKKNFLFILITIITLLFQFHAHSSNIFKAIKKNKIKKLKALLHEDININVLNKKKDTLLNAACKANNFEIVRLIIEKILQTIVKLPREERELAFQKIINYQDIYENTPLHSACKIDNPSVINTLLVIDARQDIRNKKNQVPRHNLPFLMHIITI